MGHRFSLEEGAVGQGGETKAVAADANNNTHVNGEGSGVAETVEELVVLPELPTELVLLVMSFFSPFERSFVNLALTCKRLYELSRDSSLYTRLRVDLAGFSAEPEKMVRVCERHGREVEILRLCGRMESHEPLRPVMRMVEDGLLGKLTRCELDLQWNDMSLHNAAYESSVEGFFRAVLGPASHVSYLKARMMFIPLQYDRPPSAVIAEMLEQNTHLETLILGAEHERSFGMLMSAMKRNRFLRSLTVERVHTTMNESFWQLGEMLSKNTTLSSLSLEWESYSPVDQTVQQVVDGLSNNNSLTFLRLIHPLHQHELYDRVLEYAKTHLRKFGIAVNIPHFAKMLTDAPWQELELRLTGMLYAANLHDALQDNTAIRTLKLNGTLPVHSPEKRNPVIDIIQFNTTITHLDLSHTFLAFQRDVFVRAMEANKTLVTFNVGHCALNSMHGLRSEKVRDDILKIEDVSVRLLEKNTTLQRLLLDGNPGIPSVLEPLAEQLEKNSSLIGRYHTPQSPLTHQPHQSSAW